MVDARLLAKVIKWAAGATQAKGQHFNVTNGDVFEWRNLWPAFAEVLGVRVGPDNPRSMRFRACKRERVAEDCQEA